MTVVMIVNSCFVLAIKKMIEIVCCSCTQQKLRSEKVDFYTEKTFYQNTDKIFVAPCPRHPHFKERIGSRFTNITCTCTQLTKRRRNNCKLICFNINFLADKIKVESYFDITSTTEIKPLHYTRRVFFPNATR